MNEPRLNIASMLSGSIHRMSTVFRYSSIHVTRLENVAEHSWFVAFYAYLIGMDLEGCGFKIDFGKLLSRALVHDIDESMTGDFLRYVKYGHPDLKRALDEVSVRMITRMEDELRASFEEPWRTAKHEDIEGHIIQVVDFARVISYVWEETLAGNGHVARIASECCQYLEEFCRANESSPLVPYARGIVDWSNEKMK